MKNLKKLFSIFLSLISFAQANELVYFYPIEYEEQTDLYIKLAYPIDNALIRYNNHAYYFEDNGILIPDISPTQTIEFALIVEKDNKQLPNNEEGLRFTHKKSTNIFIDKDLYKALSTWSTKENQNIPLKEYLIGLIKNEKIASKELVSFTQQFYNYKIPISKKLSDKQNIEQFFKANLTNDEESPCDCNFILNHFSSAAPVKQGSGNYQNGYNYLNHPGIPFGRLSEMINNYEHFDSNSPKWHRWYSNEKGPAHDMFLRTYDSKGQFNYQWSSLGSNNNGTYSPSPSYAYNSFQFLCVGQESNLPEDCNCTKQFCSLYEYNNILKVIARKLKPLSNVSSTAEELAIVTLTNSDGVTVVDANRNRAYTACSGKFNFEFLDELFDLAGSVVDVVVDVQDSTNGSPINDIPGAIDNVGESLMDLVSTPPVIVNGDCEDKYIKSTLLRNFECFNLKANDPTTLTLQSYTFLGLAGDRKWDNYATAKSDFRIQTIVFSGSEENELHCCSDKLGMHLYGNMGGPVSDAEHNNNVTGAYYLFGPWDDFTQVGYLPIIPNNAQRGYYIYEDDKRDCAPIKPGKKDIDWESLFSDISSTPSTQTPETSSESIKIDHTLIPDIRCKIYPNPSHRYLNIELNQLTLGSNLSITLYNNIGQVIEEIYAGTVLEENKKLVWESQHSNFTEGMYHIVLRENNIFIQSLPFLYKP